MTLIGGIGALVMLITGHKPKHFGPNVYFSVGHNWGGMSFGPFLFCCEEATEHIKYHKCGRSIQNIIWGPLMPFIIAIPSATRYWLRKMPTHLKKSIFNLFFFLSILIFTTGLACITGLIFHWHWVTIGIELLRIYLLLVSIWLTLFEIPKYTCGCSVDYDEIWFERQATRFGKKIYKKKED
jgi:hypothetical protein